MQIQTCFGPNLLHYICVLTFTYKKILSSFIADKLQPFTRQNCIKNNELEKLKFGIRQEQMNITNIKVTVDRPSSEGPAAMQAKSCNVIRQKDHKTLYNGDQNTKVLYNVLQHAKMQSFVNSKFDKEMLSSLVWWGVALM